MLYGNFLHPSYDETIGDPDDMTRWTFLQTHRRLFMRQDESFAMRIDTDFEERDAVLLLYAMIHKVIKQRNIDIDDHKSIIMASENFRKRSPSANAIRSLWSPFSSTPSSTSMSSLYWF